MRIQRKLPANFKSTDAPIFKFLAEIDLPLPSFKIYKRALLFKNGVLLNISGVQKQSLLYNSRLKEIGGNLIVLKMLLSEVFNRQFKFIRSKQNVATVINEWSNNYFHWLTEVLPKVYFLKMQISSFSVLLPINYSASFQVDSLKILEIPIINFDGIVFLKNVYLPDRQAPYSAHYNPEILKAMVGVIKAKVDCSYNLGPYIYVTRRNAGRRKLSNEEEVIKVLNKFSFKIVEFETLNFYQQVSVASNAKVMVGSHGAGLTNIMFCEPGACIYEFSLIGETMDKCYYTLADACDLNYYYQFCPSANNSNDYHFSDLTVDLEFFAKSLSGLVNAQND